MGDAPYNAGQTFQIANVVAAPVSNIDCGTITVRENWGRLFIEQRGAEIMVLRSVYPDLRNVIDHFIEPTPDAAREADLRAALSKRNKVIAKVYGRIAAVVQSISDEGDRVYFGSSNDADVLRDLAREWDDARILKEDIRTSEEEVRDLRAEVERLTKINQQLVKDFNTQNRHGAKQDAEVVRLRGLLDEAREALEFYGAKEAWNQPPVEVLEGEFGPAYRSHSAEVRRDRGQRARATLAKIGGQ